MDSFARLRSKFLASTSFNSKSRPGSETQTVPGLHLPYLVCLLQTAGYHLGKVDCINPKYMTQKGTTIEVSCGYSGQRCSLYCPEEQDMCNCFIKGEDSSNFFLEAVSQGHLEERWLVEKDSAQYCLPFISDDLKLLCKTVIMELVTMMKDNFKNMSGVKIGPPQINIGMADSNVVAVPQNSQGSTCLVLGTMRADTTYVLHTEMSSNLQKQTVTMSSEECSFEESIEHKAESWKMSSVCSAVSVMTQSSSQKSSAILKSPNPSPLPVNNTDSSSQKSSTILKSPNPSPLPVKNTESSIQKSSAVLKSPKPSPLPLKLSKPSPLPFKSTKPSPLPVKNIQKANSCCTRNSLIPTTALSNKGKSTSNLKVISGNISASKDHQSPLSISNSKSTPNLLTAAAGNNRNVGSQIKAVISKAICSPGKKRDVPQSNMPSRTKLTTSLAGSPRPPTPRITPLKNTSIKIPVRGNNVASTVKYNSTSSAVSSSASSTITSSKNKKTSMIHKEKSEKVVHATTKAAGCFSFKK